MVPAFIGGLGPWELGLILVIVLILFGAGRLPQVFASFGEGLKAFRDAQKDEPPDDTAKPREIGQDVAEAEVVDHTKEKVHNG
jgi:sec-independent protein translocase protein TatA